MRLTDNAESFLIRSQREYNQSVSKSEGRLFLVAFKMKVYQEKKKKKKRFKWQNTIDKSGSYTKHFESMQYINWITKIVTLGLVTLCSWTTALWGCCYHEFSSCVGVGSVSLNLHGNSTHHWKTKKKFKSPISDHWRLFRITKMMLELIFKRGAGQCLNSVIFLTFFIS